ncbi:MAG: hypothetical protein PHY64_14560 [Eubacteriales bacterium]|nr:hypothetical protein [Eubacteriales bacterium]
MSSLSPLLALLIAVLQMVFPIVSPVALQADGTIVADGTSSRYQLALDTSAQEFSLDLESLDTVILSLRADADGAEQTGLLGEASCTTEEALQGIGDSFEELTGKAIAWNDLRRYLMEGDFSEDVQAVIPYLEGLKNVLPEPEIFREDGETYYRLTLDEPQIEAMLSNALLYLACPTKALQALETLHLWKLIGIDAETALQSGFARLDNLPNYFSRMVWKNLNQFNLTLTWSEANETVCGIAVPQSIRAEISYLLHDQNVVWDVEWNDGALSGTVFYGDLQTAAFSLNRSETRTRLDLDYCIYERDHYKLVLAWDNAEPMSDWTLRLNEYQQPYREGWEGTPLFYLRGDENEIMFWTYGSRTGETVRGSLRWAEGECLLALQIQESTGRQQLYDITVDAEYDFGKPLFLNVDWNCDVTDGRRYSTQQYSGEVEYRLMAGDGQSMDSFSIRWTDGDEEHTVLGQSQYTLSGEGE